MHVFAFESYGVRIRIESNQKRLFDRVLSTAKRSLLGNTQEIPPDDADHLIRVTFQDNKYTLGVKGEDESETTSAKVLFNFLESKIRLVVAEHAKDFVFLHAGVISWNGKAVLFPGDSFQGKTTLVKALVKRGAVYYSDDYAIIDLDGCVHPFARRLSIRHENRSGGRSNISASTLGGVTGELPLPVGAVILTHFRENGKWDPKILTPGIGLMKIIPHTIPIRSNPKVSMQVLKIVASRAIIASSVRCDVKSCIKDLIVFIDELPF